MRPGHCVSDLHVQPSFMLILALLNMDHYPHVLCGETEAQRGSVTHAQELVRGIVGFQTQEVTVREHALGPLHYGALNTLGRQAARGQGCPASLVLLSPRKENVSHGSRAGGPLMTNQGS